MGTAPKVYCGRWYTSDLLEAAVLHRHSRGRRPAEIHRPAIGVPKDVGGFPATTITVFLTKARRLLSS